MQTHAQTQVQAQARAQQQQKQQQQQHVQGMGTQRQLNPVGPEASAKGAIAASTASADADEGRSEEAVTTTMTAVPPPDPAAAQTTATATSDAAASGDPANSSRHDAAAAATAESYERAHVHSVYESIASHFSSTRHKPWPFVAAFLASLAPGSVGLDVGCGNGKYLGLNRDVFIVGSDRSASLARLAWDRRLAASDVMVADGLALPFRPRAVDFVICIAVVHHLSTRARRVEAVRALLDCVRDGGKVLVYVWALEQGGSRRGWDEGTDPDRLVPWVMKAKSKANKDERKNGGNGATAVSSGGDTTYQRYYHLYKKGELEEDVVAARGKVLDSGYEKDNWWVIGTREEGSSPTYPR
ncbi:S-adenosyl-L-methionine-dependent methyltransferase [Xylariaceae sp. FL0662B]|nr:S-adenosyl-L-methionine-dependent methyltransferase [Xylariaceae sp. FL0662B]